MFEATLRNGSSASSGKCAIGTPIKTMSRGLTSPAANARVPTKVPIDLATINCGSSPARRSASSAMLGSPPSQCR